ncbi:hypothetical protein [Nannocystis sp.]|uniref:hypothetical protein n=1 Tax=Nannocystis sp. TaxID=1962667 RepID=UPI0025EF08EF|nr:hypothetical protein [Nannocystis sp.]MBK7823685.1 hypothetical protein [Nannocystis sp.]
MVCREDPLDEQLYRSSLRALLLTASVKDLPEADRSRPEVQTRLDAHAAEVDFAVHGMTQRLAHMPPEELARVQDRLRSDPEMAERIIEYIDDEARKSDFRRAAVGVCVASPALPSLASAPSAGGAGDPRVHRQGPPPRCPAGAGRPETRSPARRPRTSRTGRPRPCGSSSATRTRRRPMPRSTRSQKSTRSARRRTQRAKAELVVDTDPEDAAAK